MIILTNGQKSKELLGLAYFTFEKDKEFKGKGPVGKFFREESLKELMGICDAKLVIVFLWHVEKKKK